MAPNLEESLPDREDCEQRERSQAPDDYDDCKGVRDMALQSHPLRTNTSSQPVSAQAVRRPVCGDARSLSQQPQRGASLPSLALQDRQRQARDALSVRADSGAVNSSRLPEFEARNGRAYSSGSAAQQSGGRSPAGGSTSGDDFFEVTETNDWETVFVREGVSIRPAAGEVLGGRMSILRQRRSLFLTWLPHNPGSLHEDGSFQPSPDAARSPALAHSVDRTAYAVHPLPLADVKALRRYVPAFGTHHVVVILANGLTLPPLFFGQGGVRAFFSALKEHAALTKSASDPATYLVNDQGDPLQQSLAALDLPEVLLGGASAAAAAAAPPGAASEVGADGSMAGSRFGPWGQLARVKQLARDTTTSLFAGLDGAPSASVMMAGAPGGAPPLDPIAAAGPSPLAVALRRSFSGSCSAARCTSLEVDHTGVGTFELLDRAAASGGRSRRTLRGPPLSHSDLESLLGSKGQLADPRQFRKRVFECGCDAKSRKEAWKFLLGLHPPGAAGVLRAENQHVRAQDYAKLKQQWLSITDKQASRFSKWRERKGRVDKDVRRTDRAMEFFAGSHNANVERLRHMLLSYVMYNFDLGYCQGMSDLAAPLLVVMNDEAEAFWAFASLMETTESNFSVDGAGMHRQLGALRALVEAVDPGLAAFLADRDHDNYYFAFRWLLVHFKREFDFDDVLRMWEANWAAPVAQFHMWCVLAVLLQHRRPLMTAASTPDGILKYCIQLAGKLDVEAVLRDAELLAEHHGEAGARALAPLDPSPAT